MAFKASDLRLKHQCAKCDKWHTAHAIPWGEPLAFLVTGYCPHCGASYVSLRETGEGVSGAAADLSRYFGNYATPAPTQGPQTTH